MQKQTNRSTNLCGNRSNRGNRWAGCGKEKGKERGKEKGKGPSRKAEVPYMERNLDKLAEVPLWRNLDELPDHLPTVRTVATATDMNPKGGGGAGGTLLDQLVEGKVTLHPAEPLVAGGRIGHTDVGRFTLQMLRVGGTAYRPIEGRTTVAAGDDDRLAEMAPERFEHLRTEMPQVPDHLLGWFVRDASTDGCFGTHQLF